LKAVRDLVGYSEQKNTKSATPLRVILIHTHPGRNAVLNSTDTIGGILLEGIAKEQWPGASVEILSFVLPIGNWIDDKIVFQDSLLD